MLQITIRDCFWATLVVGLTIGLVVERNDVTRLRGFEQQASLWKQSAEKLRDLMERDGYKVKLEENTLEVTRPNGLGTYGSSRGMSMRGGWQVTSFLTGHVEFDWVLVLGMPLVVVILISLWLFRHRIAERLATPVPDFPPVRNNVVGIICVLGFVWFAFLAVNSYISRMPFTGALYFCFVALEAWCLKNFGFRWMTPERARKFNANVGKPFPITDLFKWD
jgi:hypothetical protein